MSKICKSCHCTYHPDPDEFEDTRMCQDCFEELEQSQNPFQEFDQPSDADNGL